MRRLILPLAMTLAFAAPALARSPEVQPPLRVGDLLMRAQNEINTGEALIVGIDVRCLPRRCLVGFDVDFDDGRRLACRGRITYTARRATFRPGLRCAPRS